MYGDPALLDTIMGEIPDTLDSEDMIYQSDTDDSGDGTEERHGDSNITEEEGENFEAGDDIYYSDVTGEEVDNEERWGDSLDTDMDRLREEAGNYYSDESGEEGLEWEHNGVIVDETEYYNETLDKFYGGLRPGGFVTSTEVKRNPIRPASFLGFKPSSLNMEHGDTVWYSDVTGDTDVMGEEDDTKESLEWEQNGVTVDESQDYRAFGDGSFLTSTGVKRNPIRPASFSPSTSPSSLGSSFTCSPMTEARRMRIMDLRRIIGEREVRASSFDMYRSLWHFATSL